MKFVGFRKTSCPECWLLEKEEYLDLTDVASSGATWQTCDFVPAIHFVVEAFQYHLPVPFSPPISASWRKKPRNPIKHERVGGRTKALSMSASVRIYCTCRTPNGLRQFKRVLQLRETQLFLLRQYVHVPR